MSYDEVGIEIREKTNLLCILREILLQYQYSKMRKMLFALVLRKPLPFRRKALRPSKTKVKI